MKSTDKRKGKRLPSIEISKDSKLIGLIEYIASQRLASMVESTLIGHDELFRDLDNPVVH